LQTALGLAAAEEAVRFEHRDLHWGNVLIKPTKTKALDFQIEGETYSLPLDGIRASIIDFTLSRLELPGSFSTFPLCSSCLYLFLSLCAISRLTHLSTTFFSDGRGSFFLDLSQTEWLFEGSGDLQFDTYRKMKTATRNKWDKVRLT
jgi:serine/threonine-protein kinase haspin